MSQLSHAWQQTHRLPGFWHLFTNVPMDSHHLQNIHFIHKQLKHVRIKNMFEKVMEHNEHDDTRSSLLLFIDTLTVKNFLGLDILQSNLEYSWSMQVHSFCLPPTDARPRRLNVVPIDDRQPSEIEADPKESQTRTITPLDRYYLVSHTVFSEQ